MSDLATLNKQRWDNCHIPEAMAASFRSVANRLSALEAKKRYQAVEKTTGVPWWFIAVVHQRESSQNWNTYLGNGQALSKKTTIVPKGRGPFKSWEEGAEDALVNCAPYAAKNKDWSVGGSLALLERYNGLGYANKGLPSPYIWAGTDQYIKGKYVADGVFDANAVDKQLGCAGLLKFMGVFKTGVTVPAVIIGAGTVAATVHQGYNWPVIAGIAAGAAILVYIGVSIYNFRKQNVK